MKVSTGFIFSHVTGWLLFLSLPILFMAGQHEQLSITKLFISPFYWLFLICYAALFYLHTYVIFPRWYESKKYVLYGTFVVCFLVLILLVQPFDKLVGLAGHEGGPFIRQGGLPPMYEGHPHEFFPDGPPREHHPGRGRPHFDIVSIILYFLTIALSIAVISFRQLRKTKEKALVAEAKKAQAELSFLKAQINPHFLFNTLNNIYALANTNHENTAPAILKLSNILRYVTEEVSDDFVPLANEITCIKDYIDLQRMRVSSKTSNLFETSGNFENHEVPPMVLMTFVENAFKFGISNHELSTITISITCSDKLIDFSCQNAVFPQLETAERTGVGLQNTRQRLDYLYKDNYELHTGAANGIYTVRLRINN